MAQPLPGEKKAVDLSAPPRVGSRIRRDPPPPPPRKISPGELREREAKIMIIGIATIGIALVVLLFELSRLSDKSPSDYTITIVRSI